MSKLLLLTLVLVFGASGAQAAARPKALTAAKSEARNETAAPSFSGQVHEARRITYFLVDALVLNNAQSHAVQAYTLAEHAALALAISDADATQAQREYLLAVHRVLSASQHKIYSVLCEQLAGTMLPLDGRELAVR
ncbi:MAG: hypothetical protein JWR44_2598 [Hymenobacter sp.]|nr:hypothetical protein [Hymenobacter sp.]